ncbi:hypothetical protein ALC60_09669, partial [Trachymyrmex zeteki]
TRTAAEFIAEVSRRNLFFSTVNFADSSLHPRGRLLSREFTFKFPKLGKVRKPVPRLGSCPTSLYTRLTLELNPVERSKENDEELPASTVKLGLPYRVSTLERLWDREGRDGVHFTLLTSINSSLFQRSGFSIVAL